MKKSFLLLLICFWCVFAFGQNELLVQHGDKGAYLNHTVVAKENFYSVGRLYNISPKEIAAFNGIDMAAGLTIGQAVKIPLTAGNYSQTASSGRAVYYVVGQKEGLYRVSTNNSGVLMANLRKWNKLAADNISTGQKLIVGYLISPEAGQIVASAPPVEKKPVVEEPKKEVVIVKEEPVKEAPKEIPKKEEPKKTEPEIRSEPPPTKPIATNSSTQTAVNDSKGSYFKTQYDQQVRVQQPKTDETASAGIFKTASGWQDAKFYALIDKVEPGTIIRIINPTNNKAIYAKVLGEMSGIRQNQGYDVRISNAAASALEITDTDKFIVRVSY